MTVPMRAQRAPVPGTVGGVDAEIEAERAGRLRPVAVRPVTGRNEDRVHLRAVGEATVPQQGLRRVADLDFEAAAWTIERDAERAREVATSPTGKATTECDVDFAAKRAAVQM